MIDRLPQMRRASMTLLCTAKEGTKRSRNPAIGLDLVIETTPGPNVSQALEVVYYEDPDPPDQLQKRGQTSKPINNCQPMYQFLYSRCSRFHSPQAWSLVCRASDDFAPRGKGISWGRCKDSEICVESRGAVNVYGNSLQKVI